jgi:hypothetical protein
MTRITSGTRFNFKPFPPWQLWKRGIGIARAIGLEPSGTIVHLQILGIGPSAIAHLPILVAQAEPFARGIVADSQVLEDPISSDAIENWRNENEANRAGVFSVPLHEAVRTVYLTASGLTCDEFIESAYPIRGDDGTFRTIRVITAPAT